MKKPTRCFRPYRLVVGDVFSFYTASNAKRLRATYRSYRLVMGDDFSFYDASRMPCG